MEERLKSARLMPVSLIFSALVLFVFAATTYGATSATLAQIKIGRASCRERVCQYV